MGDGPPGFRRNFTCSVVLRILNRVINVSLTGLSPSVMSLSIDFNYTFDSVHQSYNPKEQALWFGLFPVRSPLLWKSRLLSLPTGTEMFQFPASSFLAVSISTKIITYHSNGVPPFGNLWITAYLQLPKAYRCSSRPSSAPSAKAFTMRPCSLNHRLSCMIREKFT